MGIRRNCKKNPSASHWSCAGKKYKSNDFSCRSSSWASQHARDRHTSSICMIFISSAYSFFDLIPCNYQSLLPMFGWLSVKDLMAPEEDQLREPAEHKNVFRPTHVHTRHRFWKGNMGPHDIGQTQKHIIEN